MTLRQGLPLVQGQIVGGRCKIIKLLGAGNFGQTYLAEDLHAMNKQCALKRLSFVNNNQAALDKARELFEREGYVLLKLSEPLISCQIPRFFAYFNDNHEFFLLQELIEGHPLSDELKGGTKLQENEVADLLMDVLEVLKFIHREQIIHRDIKPENLMRRDRDGRLVLVDFGAVKEVLAQSANSSLQAKATVIYTEGYAPREQREGTPKPNSDIYALGMTAIQALTGLEPRNLAKAPRTKQVIWRNNAHVSPALAQILDKMVCDDFRHRYQSADEVINALEKFKNTLMVSSGQKPSAGVTKQFNAKIRGRAIQQPIWLWFAILSPLVMIVAFGLPLLLKSNVSSGSSTNEGITIQEEREYPTPIPKPSAESSDDIFKRPPGTP